MLLDPHAAHRYYVGSGLQFVLDTKFETDAPMGNIAASKLDDVVRATLVGLATQIAPVLPRISGWLNLAISGDEQFGQDQNFHRMKLCWSRALCLWMLSSDSATEDWSRAADHELEYWSSEQPPMSARQLVSTGCLDDYMAFCIQAGKYEQAIETYESLIGTRKLALGKVVKPRDYAYAVSLLQKRGNFDEENLFEAGRRMLQANLETEWLGRGQSLRAATWLKIVYWDRDVRVAHPPSLTPQQTLLKAYENMPNVKRPDFV